LILTGLYKFYQNGDPIAFMLPNLLLFVPAPAYTKYLWHNLIKFDSVEKTPKHIPMIQAKDFSMELLREKTDGFRDPVLVKGLFADSPATVKWKNRDYLANSVLGHQEIPVVHGAVYKKQQNNRTTDTFKNAFLNIYDNKSPKEYLFFPVQSRTAFDVQAKKDLARLKSDVNALVEQDLQLSKRIWNGFGTSIHKSFYGSQMIIGKGTNDEQTTGTGWHCALGNNYFIQVVGKKRWYFMDQKDSALLHPIRGGTFNMNTGTNRTAENQKYMNRRYADVEAGDMLYNPDWEWHTIQNYEGLSIGLPIRELNISLSFQNNFHFSSVVLWNKIWLALGVDLGGYPELVKNNDDF